MCPGKMSMLQEQGLARKHSRRVCILRCICSFGVRVTHQGLPFQACLSVLHSAVMGTEWARTALLYAFVWLGTVVGKCANQFVKAWLCVRVCLCECLCARAWACLGIASTASS